LTVSSKALAAIEAVVGTRWVRRSAAELATYASDGLPTRHSTPAAVILPADREQLIEVVKVLANHRVPFVPRVAGTGLSGGALGNSRSVNIVLTRLNRIIEIDPVDRRAVVEPGVVNARLSQAAAQYGLFYAPDPSSQSACTLGGNVAENAGGPHCFKYGVTSNHVVGLEVVTAEGKVLTLGSRGGEPWGPDLVGAFVGSEGMFGIATQIVVRLLPHAPAIQTMLADFRSLRAAGEAVSAIVASGLTPAALEMIDRNCIEAVEASIYAAGYPTDAEAVLLVELDGNDHQTVQAEAEEIGAMLADHGARSVRTATELAERMRLWQGRKKAFGALGRISPDLVVQDAVVPRSTLPDILEEISAIAERHDLVVSNVFHAGDGNLHPNLNFDRNNADEFARVELASAEIMDACVRAGGTITGEHGVGSDKIRYMTSIFDSDTLTAMRSLKLAFDPNDIANPGKVVPMHACREWKAAANYGSRTSRSGYT
jgi:glycolate oxidase subunit GlcD